MSIIKLVGIHVQADSRDEFLSTTELVRAASATVTGTEAWLLHVDAADPNRFWIYESYADESALEAHDALPELSELLSRLGDFLAEPPTLVDLELLSSVRSV